MTDLWQQNFNVLNRVVAGGVALLLLLSLGCLIVVLWRVAAWGLRRGPGPLDPDRVQRGDDIGDAKPPPPLFPAD
jgi:hypothetical protein